MNDSGGGNVVYANLFIFLCPRINHIYFILGVWICAVMLTSVCMCI